MKYKRIVIKIGTSLITEKDGDLNYKFISNLSEVCKKLIELNYEIVLISSGAVGAGMQLINKKLIDNINQKQTSVKQVLASLGQPYLMKHYQEIFDKLDIKTSQILLTRKEITEDKSTYLNIKNTIEKLIEFKIIPIINENDVVSTEELEGEKFGDNDTLSAFVSNIIDANLLIILSSIEGLFTTDPNLYPQSAKLISEIKNVGIRDIDSLGGPTTNNLGTGGMNTKLKAIELASVSGTDVIIASGKNPDNILKIINGEKIGTFFPAKLKIIERKKRWLLNNMSRSKSLTVDEGAKNAILQNNTSLLPPGIISVSGSFKAGEVVCILDKKKQLIACGITSYSNKEINKIKGKQSTDIINNLGYIHTEEIIHKNNLVNL
ncbi:MAG TPA: glutamate 5-kinase [Dehalococcoidia bacterium]|nr:glutamate 5-kinase [Dehalococcoidia bacterium]